MALDELEAIVGGGETARVEFKAEYRLDVGDVRHRDTKKSDLAWDIAALANTRGGSGYLLVGIDERTRSPYRHGV